MWGHVDSLESHNTTKALIDLGFLATRGTIAIFASFCAFSTSPLHSHPSPKPLNGATLESSTCKSSARWLCMHMLDWGCGISG